jgi:hypothetical protein
VVEQKKPTAEKHEHEGLYDKITAYGTLVSLLIAVVGLFVSIGVAAIAYFTLAFTAHWPPFSSTRVASPGNASNATFAQANAASSQSDGVPADYQGNWQGEISGPGGTFGASMNLVSGTDGSQVGVFQNNTGDCQGDIYLTRGGGPISLRIVTTSNPFGYCVSLAFAQARLTSGGLLFSFDQTGGVSPGQGTLTAS